MTRRALVALMGAVLLAAGCTRMLAVRGDRHFERADYQRAVEVYERYLERAAPGAASAAVLPPLPARSVGAFYHLAVCHALPGSPVYDAARAEELLSRLASSSAAGVYRSQAQWILALRREGELLSGELAATRARIGFLSDEMSALTGEIGRIEGEKGEETDRVQALAATIRQLQERIERLAGELERRQAELDKLKEIDLGSLP